ncbi:MAG: DNA polymerase IV [Candidatus Levybacteria bacterium]|nr:DNA polymerase IV [Candidatus Levybacteria bacterium]
MQKIILHIDFDSFFASVEQQYNPKLRGKPIGVTATNGRTCIIAASREAKRLGICTPSNIYDAKKICPSIQFVSADFVKYWEIAKKFVAIAKDYSPYVEVFSIDEVFIDVSHSVHLFNNTDNLISIIKKRIQKEIGEYITVSIGISYNKMLAKLASGLKKPNGVVTITPENVDNIYAHAKLTDICGIGERIKFRLNKIGIYTLLQLKKVSLVYLVAEFGNAEAHFLKNIGLAIDNSHVIPYTQAPEIKSVGRNYCLPKNEYDQRVVLQNIYELCEEIGIKLRRLKKVARTVGISLRGNTIISGRKTYDGYFDTGKEIFFLLHPSFHIGSGKLEYVRMISVWVENLEDKENVTLSFFDCAKQNSLQETIDIINEKFGNHTIRNGFLLYADKLTTLPNGFMADKYERTKLARE